MSIRKTCIAASALLPAALAAANTGDLQTADFSAPTLDRWNYPFNFTPGTRGSASTFGAVGIPFSFDDLDAQFLLGFDTSSQIDAGMGASNYEILSAEVTVTLTGAGEFLYSDVFQQGASIDLFGTGFRGPFNASTFPEDGPFAFGNPSGEGVRIAYATDFQNGAARDVSNYISDGITDVTPFATGVIDGATNGDIIVSDGQTVTFTLDLSNPDVILYLQQALDAGFVSFSVASTHAATQGGAATFPAFATNETDGGTPATFTITANVVPAPGVAGIALAGGLLAARRRRG